MHCRVLRILGITLTIKKSKQIGTGEDQKTLENSSDGGVLSQMNELCNNH